MFHSKLDNLCLGNLTGRKHQIYEFRVHCHCAIIFFMSFLIGSPCYRATRHRTCMAMWQKSRTRHVLGQFISYCGKRRTLRLGRIVLYRDHAVAYKEGIDREKERSILVRLQKVNRRRDKGRKITKFELLSYLCTTYSTITHITIDCQSQTQELRIKMCTQTIPKQRGIKSKAKLGSVTCIHGQPLTSSFATASSQMEDQHVQNLQLTVRKALFTT